MRESGARAWLAYVLADVGTRLVKEGDRERGEAWIEEGLALHREFGNKQGLGNKLSDLGLVSHEAGDTRAAARHYAESLHWLWEGGDVWYLASAARGPGRRCPRCRSGGRGGPIARSGGCPAGAEWRRRLAGRAGASGAFGDGSSCLAGDEVYAREAAAGRALSLPEVVAQATAMAAAFPSDSSPAQAALAGRRLRPVAPRARGAPHARRG